MGESKLRAKGVLLPQRYRHSQDAPWTYCPNVNCGPCGNIYAGPRRYVGQAFGKAHAPDLGFRPSLFADVEEQFANLRLMTAAPVMLGALDQLTTCSADLTLDEVREIARRAVQVATVGAQELN